MKGALRDAEARLYIGASTRAWKRTPTRAEACALALMQALEGE